MSRIGTPERDSAAQNVDGSGEGGFSCVDEETSHNSLSQTQGSVDDTIFGIGRVGDDVDPSSFQGSSQFAHPEGVGHGNQNGNGSSLNTSWYELEKNADKLLREELDSVERSFSPEMQLSFFKSWFEGNFKNSFLFGHFICLVKYALYEHVPDMTLDKEYLPASLLSLMRKCLTNYRQTVKDLEENVGQLNRKIAENLEDSFGDSEDCRQSLKEIMLSYQQILASATERSINSRQQAESLRLQLSEALSHVHHLENKLLLAEKSSSKLQDSLAEIQNSTTSRDELERMIATEKAMTEALKLQLGEELRSNQRLWTTLKDRNSYMAVLEAQLATCMDDASRKSRLINILAEEVVDTLHDTLPPAFLASVPENIDSSSVSSLVSTWENNIRTAIESRNKEIQKLDRQLVDCELLLADLSYKIADKQETVKYLDLEYGSLKQEEDQLRTRIENQDGHLRQLEDRSKYTEKKIAMVRQALDKKLDLLTCTKDRLERNVREIARLQKVRISVPREDSISECSSFVDQNRDSAISTGGSTVMQPTYSITEEQDAIKTFASFDGSRFLRRSSRDPRWCSTPMKPAQYAGHDEQKYPTSQVEHSVLKKIAAVKSPSRLEPTQYNVRFKSAEQFKHIKGEPVEKEDKTTSSTPSTTRRTTTTTDNLSHDSGCAGDAANYDGNKESVPEDSSHRNQQRQKTPSAQRKLFHDVQSKDKSSMSGKRSTWMKLHKPITKTGIGMNVLGKRGHFNITDASAMGNQFTGAEVRSPKRDSQWRH